MNICLKCKNAGICKSRLKGEDVKECSRYIDATIDWEQRRYEVAKDILATLIAHPTSTTGNFCDKAIAFADTFIDKLKRSKL